MFLGIDVGGTHTDAVLLSSDFKVLKSSKTETCTDVLTSLLVSFKALGFPKNLKRLTISSTLSLNTVFKKHHNVGIIATSSPGLAPQVCGQHYKLLKASQDHLGSVLENINEVEVRETVLDFLAKGVNSLAIVSKFSPKNPEFEKEIAKIAQKVAQEEKKELYLTLGSDLSGKLNFPRRQNSAYLNAVIRQSYGIFLKNLALAVEELAINCPIFILKADGGTMNQKEALDKPLYALTAGPAASLMGLWALENHLLNTIMLDIGGTTTDIAFLINKQPLLEDGLVIDKWPTLVRGLLTRSIPLGGDSAVYYKNGNLSLGSVRLGMALALKPEDFLKRPPTLTDALNVLEITKLGDVSISKQAFEKLGGLFLARKTLDLALSTIKNAVDDLLLEVKQKPVYTINEILVKGEIKPLSLALLGGPAQVLKEEAEKVFKLPTIVPKFASMANAMGAALAKETKAVELYADTILGKLSIPSLGYFRYIDKNYHKKDAEKEILEKLSIFASDPQIVTSESFAQISDYDGAFGKIIRVSAQIKSGLLGKINDC